MLLSQRTAERLLRYAIVALIAFSILWRGGKGLEATWMLGGVGVLCSFEYWSSRSARERALPKILWWILMAFLALTVLSFLRSSTSNYGLDEVFRDTGLALVFLWVARRDPAGKTTVAQWFLAVLVPATLLACGIGMLVYFLQPVSRFVGTFFDSRFHTDYWPNAWAEFLLLVWPLVWVWMAKRGRVAAILSLGVVLGALLLSYSRGAFIVFCGQLVLSGLIFLITGWKGRQKISTRMFTSCMVILIGVTAMASLVFVGANSVRSTFHEIESVARKATFSAAEGSSSISERRAFWEESFTLSLERPLLGWGPYSFRFVQPRIQHDVYATSDHPHNVFLKLAMERGWPAAGLFAFFILIIFYRALSLIIVGDSGRRPADPLMIALLIGTCGVIAHTLIDYNLQFVGIALPFWIALGLMVPSSKRAFAYTKTVRIFELLVATILAVALVSEGRYLVLSSLGRHAEVAGQSQTALYWYRRSSGEIFSRDMHLSTAALELSLAHSQAAAAALDVYEKANAEDARLWILRGDLAMAQGEGEAAGASYSRAVALGRYNYLRPLEGILRLVVDDVLPPLNEQQKTEYHEIFRRFGEAILRNAHFIALSENVETLERVSELFQGLYPRDAKMYREFTTAVLENAEKERSSSSSRTPGLLW